jgi:hypothetical protein
MATNLMLIHVPRRISLYEIYVNNLQTISSYLAESTMHLRYKMFSSVEGGECLYFVRVYGPDNALLGAVQNTVHTLFPPTDAVLCSYSS